MKKIAEHQGTGWDSKKRVEVWKSDMYTVFKIWHLDTFTSVEMRATHRQENAIEINVSKNKNGRTYLSSVSIPEELAELFIKSITK